MSSSVKMTGEVDRLVGSRVRARRLELGFSQQKLATALGLTFPQVQKYENGKNRISVSRLQQIADVLQADMAELVSGLTGEPVAPLPIPLDGSEAEFAQLWTRVPTSARVHILGLMRSLAKPVHNGPPGDLHEAARHA